MPKVTTTETPSGLRAYYAHGLTDLTVRGDEAAGDCPNCGRKAKFSINTGTGLAHCVHADCAVSWNPIAFLRWVAESGSCPGDQASMLAADRGLLSGDTVRDWGFVLSPITGEWVVPGYGPGGKVDQVYRYEEPPGRKDRRVLMATPGIGHGLLGMGLWDQNKPNVFVCEGPWDAMCLWEVFKSARPEAGGFMLTGRPDAATYKTTNVIAAPTCSVFDQLWSPLFAGKTVTFLYDSDHPKQGKAGNPMPPAGWAGVKHACTVLAGAKDRPAEVRALWWGEDGYDPAKPSGYDVRDWFTAETTLAGRVRLLGEFLGKVRPVPAEWSAPKKAVAVNGHHHKARATSCTSWRQLQQAWKRAMTWTEGLDRALAVMLASCASVRLVGDQLWVKIVSPPGTGKSTLCEALAESRHIVAKSVIRGFHSGYDQSGTGTEDNSLLVGLSDKTLVLKDGDTLLQQPNLPQILAEARDIYDRVSRTHYRNKSSKDYKNVNMTFILCGTSSLRKLDSSELGERFLDCVIMDQVEDDLEDSINLRAINDLCSAMATEPSVNGTTVRPAEQTARELTGAYIDHLRQVIDDEVRTVTMPEGVANEINALGKFVAFMRTRPSLTQKEEVNRELSTRLVKQLSRLAFCLAVVTNRRSIDGGIMDWVRKVAMDTARGRTYDLVKVIDAYDGPTPGVTTAEAGLLAREDDDDCRALLGFLRKIKVLELVRGSGIFKGSSYWRLTARMKTIWRNAHSAKPAPG